MRRGKEIPFQPGRVAILALSMLALPAAGCAAAQPGPAPIQMSSAAPVKLCAPAPVAPDDIAAKPGYTQYVVTVEEAGKPLTDLKQADFVASYGGEAAPIEFFRADDGDLPVSIAVVIDSSGSMQGKLVVSDASKLQATRDAISSVAGKINACDEIAVVAFGAGHELSSIRVIQPLTTDHALAMKRVNEIVPYGQTPLYDSIHGALKLLASAHYPDRVLIVVTDGMDNTSVLSLTSVIAEATKSGVPVYGIGLGNPGAPSGPIHLGPFVLIDESERLDAKTLKTLSDATGGQSFIVSPVANDTGAQFAAAVASINGLLGHGYTIGVIARVGQPPAIRVANHPDAIVHAFHIPEKSAPANAPQGPPKPT